MAVVVITAAVVIGAFVMVAAVAVAVASVMVVAAVVMAAVAVLASIATAIVDVVLAVCAAAVVNVALLATVVDEDENEDDTAGFQLFLSSASVDETLTGDSAVVTVADNAGAVTVVFRVTAWLVVAVSKPVLTVEVVLLTVPATVWWVVVVVAIADAAEPMIADNLGKSIFLMRIDILTVGSLPAVVGTGDEVTSSFKYSRATSRRLAVATVYGILGLVVVTVMGRRLEFVTDEAVEPGVVRIFVATWGFSGVVGIFAVLVVQ